MRRGGWGVFRCWAYFFLAVPGCPVCYLCVCLFASIFGLWWGVEFSILHLTSFSSCSISHSCSYLYHFVICSLLSFFFIFSFFFQLAL